MADMSSTENLSILRGKDNLDQEAYAKITRAEGGSFSGYVFELFPPLNEARRQAAEDLGATVLGDGVGRSNSTLVLVSHELAADRFPQPGERLTEVGDFLLAHIFETQTAQ